MNEITLSDGSGITNYATNDTIGFDDITFSWSLDEETGTVNYGVSSDLIFKGAAYEYLRNSIWNCEERGCDKTVTTTLNLECCDANIVAKIDPYDSEYCPFDCQIKSSITIDNPVNAAFECLKDNQYWKGFYFGLDFGGLITNPNNFLNGFTPVVFDYQNSIPTRGILLREALDNMAQQCDLNFCSSIFDSAPYSNIVMIHSELAANPWYGRNTPTMTSVQLLNCLKDVFNADYQIQGDKLIFERKDYFNASKTILKLSDFEFDTNPCFQYVKGENCAYLDIQYSKDTNFVEIGQEQYTNQYSDIIEWNDPPLPGRTGACEKNFKFSTPAIDEDTGEILYQLTENPILVIWDGVSPREDAKVLGDDCGYNTPLWVRGDVPCNTLYQNFHEIDNPNLQEECSIELTDNVTLRPKDFCAFFELIQERGINIGIDTEVCGIFYPKEVVVSPKDKTVSFNELFVNV